MNEFENILNETRKVYGFGRNRPIDIKEGKQKGLQAILRVYRDSEKGLPPDESDLDEGLYLFLEYLEDMNKIYRKDPEVMMPGARSKEHAAEVMQRYAAREKEVRSALKSSSDRVKIIALDNVIDLVHHDYYAIEQMLMGRKARANSNLKALAFQIVTLLRKLDKFPHATDIVDPKKWQVVPYGHQDQKKKYFDTEEEAQEYIKYMRSKGFTYYSKMEVPRRADVNERGKICEEIIKYE